MGLGDGVESGRECEVAGRAGKEVRDNRSDLAVVCWGEKGRVDWGPYSWVSWFKKSFTKVA